MLIMIAPMVPISGFDLQVAWAAQPIRSQYRLENSVMGAAGTVGSSPGFRGGGTLGQPTPIGISDAGGRRLFAGFWFNSLNPQSTPEEALALGMRTYLYASIPNPFSRSTAITYSLTRGEKVNLVVFNVLGQRIRTLADEQVAPGTHIVIWDGRDSQGDAVSPGVYFYRLKTSYYTSVRKAIVLK